MQETGRLIDQKPRGTKEIDPDIEFGSTSVFETNQIKEYKETGLTDCGCNAGFNSGIVLDCFMGSGTTALVAMQNARNFVGIELNQDYIKMAMERLEPYLKQQRITEFA